MVTEKIKAIELVYDWNLWPRHSVNGLDGTNVARMREALRSGFPLPPVIANKADYRIIDGFHRTQAHLDAFGDDAEIEVEFRTYDTEAAMFLEAGVLNAHQGMPMGPKDRAHFILRCRKYKYPWGAIAKALCMDEKRLREFVEKRSAKTKTGESIPLPGGAINLGGKVLTETQEHYARHTGGVVPEMYVSMLINALKSDALMLDEKGIVRLKQLRALIDEVLDGCAA